MNAQGIVKGDMDGDGEVTITDVTSAVDVILGKAPKQTISQVVDPYAVDNTLVVGTWRASDGETSFTLNEDGSTNYPEATTYKFRPYQGTLMFFNSQGQPIKTIEVNEVEKGRYLLTVNYLTDTYTYYYCDNSGSIEGRDYVDLGLPSGTLWATCNVGASKPEVYGDYFAWGETTGYNGGKTDFGESNYNWCNGSGFIMTKYCTDSRYGNNGFVDNKTELDLEDDAAYENWGPAWRMPSIADFEELVNSSYTTTEWTTQNGVNGRLITSKSNGNSIFFPAAGTRIGSSLVNVSVGYYWSRTLYERPSYYARNLLFNSGDVITGNNYRYDGLSVRPVRSSE